MPFYQVNLVLFAAVNVVLLHRQYQARRRQAESGEPTKDDADNQVESQQLLKNPTELKAAARRFQIEYFTVYAFAVAADWVQVGQTSML
jgi:MFS transporter, MFS domain-containing protein family, molybdate-anion transporter